MASNQGQGRGCAYLAVLVLSSLLAAVDYAVAASTYTVGDSDGWKLGVNYSTWAQKYSFGMGDAIVFNYNPASHSVYLVSQSDYQACNLNSALKSYNSGSDTVTLATSSAYFVCGTPGHCQQGMKVAIVTSSSTNSTPISPPSSGGSPGTPPTGTKPPVAPGPHGSGAASLQVISASASILLSMAAAVSAFLM